MNERTDGLAKLGVNECLLTGCLHASMVVGYSEMMNNVGNNLVMPLTTTAAEN